MSDEAYAEETTAPSAPEEAPQEEVTQEEQGGILDNVEPAAPEQSDDTEYVNTPEKPPEEPTEEERPEWLPEKFKSPEELVKAYNEMGKKIREKSEPPESYEIQLEDGTDLELTEEDAQTFKDAGLTNDQAKHLSQYFHNTVMPALIEAKTEIEVERLSNEWNMPADSNEFQQQLAKAKAWANQNLPDAVTQELSRSAKGVQTIVSLMEQGAKGNKAVGESSSPRPAKSDLMNLMNDERYWNGDEDYRQYVRQQFERAFD